jgi:endonuclease YncB( thermonuclease family)
LSRHAIVCLNDSASVSRRIRKHLNQGLTGLCGADAKRGRTACAEERARAIAARNVLRRALLAAQSVEIDLLARDKYFRVLALIRADGVDLAHELVRVGLATPYEGGSKTTVC